MPPVAFADQVVARLGEAPTSSEILVEGVAYMRDAEAERRFDETPAAINRFPTVQR